MSQLTKSYYNTYIPHEIQNEMETFAFQKLCQHLRERSDVVSNIELMTLSGFCRNCLAKVRIKKERG